MTQSVDLSGAVQAIEQRLAVCNVPGVAVGITDRQRVRSVVLQAFTALTTPVLDDYAYGLFVKNEDARTSWRHGGGIGGYGCALVVHPEEGFGLALMCNGPRCIGKRRRSEWGRKLSSVRRVALGANSM